MAISPISARSTIGQQLTEEETAQAAEIERMVDVKLGDAIRHDQDARSASFALEDVLADSVSPAVVSAVIERYKSAGWPDVVIIHSATNPNLQFQFNW
jgi:hypothetical protein